MRALIFVLAILVATLLVPTFSSALADDASPSTAHFPILYLPAVSNNPLLPGMVLIPAGEFQMGCDDDTSPFACDADELPLHTVYLDAYYIDEHEVTNARYQACVDAGVCSAPQEDGSKTRDSYFGNPDYADYPVIYVDWFQAEAFCAWGGNRLPSEAQWEKAARGSDDTRVYAWGIEEPTCDLVNGYVGDWCTGDTNGVGSYPEGASPYGVMDMTGNVWEWTNDWYNADYYAESPTNNPPGPATGEKRVLRGGSWFDTGSGALRFVNRPANDPNGWGEGYGTLGFRCARSQ